MTPHPVTPGVDEALLSALGLESRGGDGTSTSPAWTLTLEAIFGSIEQWRAAFVAQAEALAGAPGWLVLGFRPSDGRLVHRALGGAHPASGDVVPLLALDLEAQPPGAGANAAVAAFVAGIDWSGAYARYQAAVHAATEPLGATQAEVAGKLLLDVRRAGVHAQSPQRIDGARWSDPARVDEWAPRLPAGQPVIVYCVYGHEVGQVTALRLRAAGVDARFLAGGIDAWQAAGLPLVDKA